MRFKSREITISTTLTVLILRLSLSLFFASSFLEVCELCSRVCMSRGDGEGAAQRVVCITLPDSHLTTALILFRCNLVTSARSSVMCPTCCYFSATPKKRGSIWAFFLKQLKHLPLRCIWIKLPDQQVAVQGAMAELGGGNFVRKEVLELVVPS